MLDLTASPVAVITPPSVEPVTVAQMKEHLRIDSDTEDSYLAALIPAARVTIEQETNRAFLSQTLRLRLDTPPSARELILPRAPLQAVTSITYTTTAGDSAAFSGTLDAITEQTPARVRLRDGYEWPSDVAQRAGAFAITYTAGAPNVAALDPRIIHAVRFLVAHWYAHREPVNVGNIVNPLPRAIDALCWQLRVF